ncbi:MAG: MFS transporter [Chlamydiia bacterium]|nr:MFS transporter [Chlamydiia bacterium]
MTIREYRFLFLIFVIFTAACIETDIYLPTFPDMMRHFAVTEEIIQSILTWNFIGICLAGPFYGPLSDAFGRKRPLMVSLGLFLFGSVMTVVTDSFSVLLFGRVFQGIGSGGCFTLGTAIIFDLFQEEKAIAATTKLNFFVPFVMAGAPMVGAFLNHSFGFRANFLAIAILVLISFVICGVFLPEPLPKAKRVPLNRKQLIGDFKRAFLSLPFWQTTAIVSLIFANYLCFLSISAVLLVLQLGVSKNAYPFFQGSLLIGWLIATLFHSRVIASWGIPKVKQVGTVLTAAGGFGFFFSALLFPENPYLLTGMMIVYSFGANWIQGIYFPEGMEVLPDIKGITASLLTSFRLLVTAAMVALASVLYNGTILPAACLMTVSLVIILITIFRYENSRDEIISVAVK